MSSRAGYVSVIEAEDNYDTFVTNINAAISEAFDRGVGVKDIKYVVLEARGKVTYSALLVFDDQNRVEPEP